MWDDLGNSILKMGGLLTGIGIGQWMIIGIIGAICIAILLLMG